MRRTPHGDTEAFARAARGNVMKTELGTSAPLPAGRLRCSPGLQTDQSHEPPYVAVAAEQSRPGFPNTMSGCYLYS